MRLRDPKGSALILVLIAVGVLGALIAAGYAIISHASNETKVELELKGQTEGVAESGITEALSWFRRSLKQPVDVFDPEIYEAELRPKNVPTQLCAVPLSPVQPSRNRSGTWLSTSVR